MERVNSFTECGFFCSFTYIFAHFVYTKGLTHRLHCRGNKNQQIKMKNPMKSS